MNKDFFTEHWKVRGCLLPFSNSFRNYIKNTHQILEAEKKPFETPEETVSFCVNVITEFFKLENDKLAILMNNNQGAKIFEELLPFLPPEYFRSLMLERLVGFFSKLTMGQFSSFILEKCFGGLIHYASSDFINQEDIDQIITFICEEYQTNLEVLSYSPSSSHTLISFLKTLISCKKNEKAKSVLFHIQIFLFQQQNRGKSPLDLIEEKQFLGDFFAELLKIAQNCDEEAFSALLESLFKITVIVDPTEKKKKKKPSKNKLTDDEETEGEDENENEEEEEEDEEQEKKKKKKKVVLFNFENFKLIETCKNMGGLRIVEGFLNTLKQLQLTQFYFRVLKKDLITFSFDRGTNFVIALFLERSMNLDVFGDILNQLHNQLSSLWKEKKRRIVQHVVKNCVKYRNKDRKLMTKICRLFFNQFFKEPNGKEMMNLLIFDNFEIETVSLGGCAVLTDFYKKFDAKDIFPMNEMLCAKFKENPRILKLLCMNKYGVQFLQKFFVVFKKNRQLIEILKGSFMELAVQLDGSKMIEMFFRIGNVSIKLTVGKELVSDEEKLQESVFGRIVYSKFKLWKIKKRSQRNWLNEVFGKDKISKNKKIVSKKKTNKNDKNDKNNKNNKNNRNRNNNKNKDRELTYFQKKFKPGKKKPASGDDDQKVGNKRKRVGGPRIYDDRINKNNNNNNKSDGNWKKKRKFNQKDDGRRLYNNNNNKGRNNNNFRNNRNNNNNNNNRNFRDNNNNNRNRNNRNYNNNRSFRDNNNNRNNRNFRDNNNRGGGGGGGYQKPSSGGGNKDFQMNERKVPSWLAKK